MRKKIVAGNWKMNTLPAEGVALAQGIAAGKGDVCDCVNFIVCPPFTHLHSVIETLKGTAIAVGAQDCATEVKGAYTGEVAAEMIAALGCKYVILGHSERRQYYGETSETLNKKMARAYENNLTPIYCVGENLEEREANRHFEVVKAQLEEVVFNLTEEQFANLVIAYEPVWAIGTGKTATADQAEEVCDFIRMCLKTLYGLEVASAVTIQYGGSMNDQNAAELLAKTNVDGGLIGGASLVAEKFVAIVKAADASTTY
jgi:triosephosphate isomerase